MKCDICLKEIKPDDVISVVFSGKAFGERKMVLCLECYVEVDYIIHKKFYRNLQKQVNEAKADYEQYLKALLESAGS